MAAAAKRKPGIVVERSPLVDSHIEALVHVHKAQIVQLRELIHAAVPGLSERIKWNAPSFGLGDDDRVTMRLHPGDRLQLILHRGAKAGADDFFRFEDPAKIIAWAAPDRGVITIKDGADLAEKSNALRDILKRWIACTNR